MFSSKDLRIFIVGFLTCALMMGMVFVAFAESDDVTIQALLSNTIKLKLNGQDWTPKDPATGDYYKPIVYNGRTYLPLAAVLGEAAKIPVDYDGTTKTVWIGGRSDSLPVDNTTLYEDYYGTIITTDADKLTTPGKTYKWGITNNGNIDMQYFTCYLKPNGNYKRFRVSFFVDSSAQDKYIINIRNNTYDGAVIKTVTLNPGQTIENIDIDTGGINKLCIESEAKINHGTIKKIVFGEPTFYNGTLTR
ncbi:MAG: hypothetical protein ABRQ26_14890 [Syntrophomonadaceae bacterium]